MESNDIGGLAEALFAGWMNEDFSDVTRPHNDLYGWDFLLNFKYTKNSTQRIESAYIQIKGTFTNTTCVSITARNAILVNSSNIPIFVVLIQMDPNSRKAIRVYICNLRDFQFKDKRKAINLSEYGAIENDIPFNVAIRIKDQIVNCRSRELPSEQKNNKQNALFNHINYLTSKMRDNLTGSRTFEKSIEKQYMALKESKSMFAEIITYSILSAASLLCMCLLWSATLLSLEICNEFNPNYLFWLTISCLYTAVMIAASIFYEKEAHLVLRSAVLQIRY